VTGSGLATVTYSLFALVLIGAAGCLASAKMFRWDSQQRFRAETGRGWAVVALAAWLAVGTTAEVGGRINIVSPERSQPAAAAVVSGETPTAGRTALDAAVDRG